MGRRVGTDGEEGECRWGGGWEQRGGRESTDARIT